MNNEINDLNDLIQVSKLVEGYMIGITTIDKGRLNHHLLTHKFPLVDLLRSCGEVKKLAIKRLEEGEMPTLPEF